MSLLVVSSIHSPAWVKCVHERIPSSSDRTWNEEGTRLLLEFEGWNAIIQLIAATAEAEGRPGVHPYDQLVPVRKFIYLPQPWAPSSTIVTRSYVDEPSFIGNAGELGAQLAAIGGSLQRALGPLPVVPARQPPIELAVSSASDADRVKSTWLVMTYAAWLSVETQTPLHGLYGGDASEDPVENWKTRGV
jgi:hypothetical protein